MSSAVSLRWIPHHAKTAWRLYKKSHWTSLLRPKLLVKPGCTSAFSSSSSRHQMECQRLDQRTLIRVAGTDAEEFLQGLVTNDLQCFHQHDCKSLYSMVLNLKGRVLYDIIIYNVIKDNGSPHYLIECDQSVAKEMLKKLKVYKIRKKVDMAAVGDEYKVWCVLPPDGESIHESLDVSQPAQIIANVKDPRVSLLGHRLILPDNVKAPSVVNGLTEAADKDLYRLRRYQLGIGEGTVDFPPGNCTPLECNVVFLNGVSFQKGCYIGQELTARTHHTGVIRKRLMPLILERGSAELASDDPVENEGGKSVGKIRGVVGRHGLGLLRVAEVTKSSSSLVIKHTSEEDPDHVTAVPATTNIPQWWPKDDDKLNQTISTPK